jgi:hypothetical protein
MKIRSVQYNNRKRLFEISAGGKTLSFPYSKAVPTPSAEDLVRHAGVDRELGREAFTFTLESGAEGSVHLDWVLEHNKDPWYLRDLLLHQLTVEALKRVEGSRVSKRELARRLGTSSAQLYRLLNPANYQKSVDQLVSLLQLLDCDVELVVRPKTAKPAA